LRAQQLHAQGLLNEAGHAVQTGHQAAEMARAAGAVDVARMSVVVHANLESEEQVSRHLDALGTMESSGQGAIRG
jgi:hypothetical protein